MSETAQQIYESFKADVPRVSERWFESHFGAWLRNPALKAEVLESVRELFLADKEKNRLAQWKRDHPLKPRGARPYECAVVPTTDPLEKGYVSANPLRALRMANTMSKKTFCQRTEMSTLSLSKYERCGLPDDPMWRGLAVDRIGNVFGVDVSKAFDGWRSENPYLEGTWVGGSMYGHAEPDQRSKGQRAFLERKYRDIGHSLIETERIQRELRIQVAFAKKDLQKRANRPGTPLDVMGDMVAALERLHNREVSEEVRRLRLVEDCERTKRALDAIKRDEDIAAEWAEKHKDELAPFKQDWKLYFGVPLIGKPDDGAAVRVPSEDFTQMRAVDSTGHLLLEDAIIAKIDKQKEGYFVQLDYDGRSHAITLLNNDDFRAFPNTERVLDDIREMRVDKRSLGYGHNGALNHGDRFVGKVATGLMNGHNVGDAGRRFDAMMLEEQAEIARREAARKEVRERVYEVQRYAAETPAPMNDHSATPIEMPEAPKVLPENIDPIDLAVPIADPMAWKKETKDRRGRAGGWQRIINNRGKKASQR